MSEILIHILACAIVFWALTEVIEGVFILVMAHAAVASGSKRYRQPSKGPICRRALAILLAISAWEYLP